MVAILPFLVAFQDMVEIFADANVDWKTLAIVFLIMSCALEVRQILRYPVDDKESSPDGLSSQLMPVKPEEVYGRDKALFSLILIIYSRAVGVLFLYYNELAQSWNLAGKLLGGYKDYEILCSTVFLGILTVVDDIRNLPAMFYDNPDLRQKLGSITTSWWIVVNYPLERWAHPATFASGPLVLVFLRISKGAGDDFILYVMSIWMVRHLLRAIYHPLVLWPLLEVALPSSGLSRVPSESPLRARVETLAVKSKFPLGDLYVFDRLDRSKDHSKILFSGLPWHKNIVICSTLMDESNTDEAVVSVALELADWSYSHSLKLMILDQARLLFGFFASQVFLRSRPLVKAFGFPLSVYAHESGRRSSTVVMYILAGAMLRTVDDMFLFALEPLARRFDLQADRFVCDLGHLISHPESGSAETKVEAKDGNKDEDDIAACLARVLVRLHTQRIFAARGGFRYGEYHSSYFAIVKRLNALDDYRARKR